MYHICNRFSDTTRNVSPNCTIKTQNSFTHIRANHVIRTEQNTIQSKIQRQQRFKWRKKPEQNDRIKAKSRPWTLHKHRSRRDYIILTTSTKLETTGITSIRKQFPGSKAVEDEKCFTPNLAKRTSKNSVIRFFYIRNHTCLTGIRASKNIYSVSRNRKTLFNMVGETYQQKRVVRFFLQ